MKVRRKTKAKQKEDGRKRRLRNLRPPWKPGQSGNPQGRPTGSGSILGFIKQRLRCAPWHKKAREYHMQTLADELAFRLVQLGRRGNVAALQMILDKTESRAITEEELQQTVDQVYRVVTRHVRDKQQLAAIARDIRQLKGQDDGS